MQMKNFANFFGVITTPNKLTRVTIEIISAIDHIVTK